MAYPPDPLRSGPQLTSWRTKHWLADEDIVGPLVVFVHGFSASTAPLATLAEYIANRFAVAMFDYSSHAGVETGAADLSRRLQRFAVRLQDARFALIAHSMGGLVAKQFARSAANPLQSVLAGIATLGTPHGGIQGRGLAVRRRLVAMMLDAFEEDGAPNPYARSWLCPAARQLIGTDSGAVVASLLDTDRSTPLNIPMLTLSGGRNYIELFAPGTRWNAIANRLIQANLALPNDGLVEEASANLGELLGKPGLACRHANEYGGWSVTNHTYLVSNQDVGELLLDWLTTEVFAILAPITPVD